MRNILGGGYEVKISSEHPGPGFSPLSLVSALDFLGFTGALAPL